MTYIPSIRTAPANLRSVPALLLAVTLLVGCAGPGNAVNQAPNRVSVKQMVIREARNMGIPPSLALAVAHAESNFNARARSHKGARGVMQIMPATARGEYGVHPDRLWNPRVNIRLGLHFLGRLIQRYDGRTDLALSYYNGGSAVGRPGRARVIPATRSYVRKVQQLRRQYRQQLRRGQV
jgi:soluble lytic murein transglycosylase-like protein